MNTDSRANMASRKSFLVHFKISPGSDRTCSTPSGGLVNNPQDVTFFDFHLVDPKDAPFAIFRLHYRSWANLEELNIVPRDDSSMFATPDANAAAHKLDHVATDDETKIIEQESSPSVEAIVLGADPDESVFDDSISIDDHDRHNICRNKPRRSGSFVLRTPPQLRPQSPPGQHIPQPSKTIRDGVLAGFPESYCARPLPDRPLPSLPMDGHNDTWVPRSRKSSNASATPSVAPSLLSYIKNESYVDETVVYGQAKEMPMDKDHPGVPIDHEDPGPAMHAPFDELISDHEQPLAVADNQSPKNSGFLLLGECATSKEIMLEKHLSHLEESQGLSDGGQFEPRDNSCSKKASMVNGELKIDFSKYPHLKLSESEWIRRTPSPQSVPRRLLSPRLGRLWNTLRRNKSRSPLRGMKENLGPRNHSSPDIASTGMRKRPGNWI